MYNKKLFQKNGISLVVLVERCGDEPPYVSVTLSCPVLSPVPLRAPHPVGEPLVFSSPVPILTASRAQNNWSGRVRLCLDLQGRKTS